MGNCKSSAAKFVEQRNIESPRETKKIDKEHDVIDETESPQCIQDKANNDKEDSLDETFMQQAASCESSRDGTVSTSSSTKHSLKSEKRLENATIEKEPATPFSSEFSSRKDTVVLWDERKGPVFKEQDNDFDQKEERDCELDSKLGKLVGTRDKSEGESAELNGMLSLDSTLKEDVAQEKYANKEQQDSCLSSSSSSTENSLDSDASCSTSSETSSSGSSTSSCSTSEDSSDSSSCSSATSSAYSSDDSSVSSNESDDVREANANKLPSVKDCSSKQTNEGHMVVSSARDEIPGKPHSTELSKKEAMRLRADKKDTSDADEAWEGLDKASFRQACQTNDTRSTLPDCESCIPKVWNEHEKEGDMQNNRSKGPSKLINEEAQGRSVPKHFTFSGMDNGVNVESPTCNHLMSPERNSIIGDVSKQGMYLSPPSPDVGYEDDGDELYKSSPNNSSSSNKEEHPKHPPTIPSLLEFGAYERMQKKQINLRMKSGADEDDLKPGTKKGVKVGTDHSERSGTFNGMQYEHDNTKTNLQPQWGTQTKKFSRTNQLTRFSPKQDGRVNGEHQNMVRGDEMVRYDVKEELPPPPPPMGALVLSSAVASEISVVHDRTLVSTQVNDETKADNLPPKEDSSESGVLVRHMSPQLSKYSIPAAGASDEPAEGQSGVKVSSERAIVALPAQSTGSTVHCDALISLGEEVSAGGSEKPVTAIVPVSGETGTQSKTGALVVRKATSPKLAQKAIVISTMGSSKPSATQSYFYDKPVRTVSPSHAGDKFDFPLSHTSLYASRRERIRRSRNLSRSLRSCAEKKGEEKNAEGDQKVTDGLPNEHNKLAEANKQPSFSPGGLGISDELVTSTALRTKGSSQAEVANSMTPVRLSASCSVGDSLIQAPGPHLRKSSPLRTKEPLSPSFAVSTSTNSHRSQVHVTQASPLRTRRQSSPRHSRTCESPVTSNRPSITRRRASPSPQRQRRIEQAKRAINRSANKELRPHTRDVSPLP